MDNVNKIILLVGHFADSCPEPERLCYNCKQPGHEANQCPQPRTAEAKQCYSCGGGKNLIICFFSSITLFRSYL